MKTYSNRPSTKLEWFAAITDGWTASGSSPSTWTESLKARQVIRAISRPSVCASPRHRSTESDQIAMANGTSKDHA